MTAMYIGIMSGTSMDGIDLVAASFDPLVLHATLTVPFPEELRDELMALSSPGDNEIERMGQADVAYARLVGQAVLQLLEENNLDCSQIIAIGSHGQTIRHRPHLGFSLQIGDPNLIAEISKIPVVSDFRRRDLAAGGQGAPLVPAFHQALFGHASVRTVIRHYASGSRGVAHAFRCRPDPTSIEQVRRQEPSSERVRARQAESIRLERQAWLDSEQLFSKKVGA